MDPHMPTRRFPNLPRAVALAGMALATACAAGQPAPTAPCALIDAASAQRTVGERVHAAVDPVATRQTEEFELHGCDWSYGKRGVFTVLVRHAVHPSKNEADIQQLRDMTAFAHPRLQTQEVRGTGDYAQFQQAPDGVRLVVFRGLAMVHLSLSEPTGAPDVLRRRLTALANRLLDEPVASTQAGRPTP
jgi:hypothetical protein